MPLRSITTEINAIDQLKDKIEALNRAKAEGVTSRFGGAADDAALQQAQNQLASVKESQAEAARYNRS
jgi:hypothetical protein